MEIPVTRSSNRISANIVQPAHSSTPCDINNLDRLNNNNNNDKKDVADNCVDYTLRDKLQNFSEAPTEGGRAAVLLQSSFTAAPTVAGSWERDRCRLACLSGAASSQAKALSTPPLLLSPSSPSSSPLSVGQLTAAAAGSDAGGASGAGYDYRQDQRLVLHRQSLPGHGGTEEEDALGELRQRLLYHETSGRKHSVDSGLAAAQRRVPTFVRTYREVAWKRVNKNHNKQKANVFSTTSDCPAAPYSDTGDTTSTTCLTSSASPTAEVFTDGAVTDVELRMRKKSRSRAGSFPDVTQQQQSDSQGQVTGAGSTIVSDYVNGQHIKRGRVPIFITADPGCPRRFSADDLVSMDQSQAQWAARGRCLVIRPSVPLSTTGQDQVVPPSQTAGSAVTNTGQHGSDKRRRQDSVEYEFSLEEDDDDDDDDDDEDGDDDEDDEEDEDDDDEDEEAESKDSSKDEFCPEASSPPLHKSSSDTSLVPQKYFLKFSNSLHRLALGNSTLRKTIALAEHEESRDVTVPRHITEVSLVSSPDAGQNGRDEPAVNTLHMANTSEGETNPSLRSNTQSWTPTESLPPQLRRTSVCWTLARPVDGTLPVNLQGAVPIAVEFVQSDALSDNGEPLWLQKMIFPPGVQVSSTQWSANFNWVPAVRGGSDRRRRYLVRAEIPGDGPSDLARHVTRRVSDAFAPYNKNSRNGVHAPKVMTLTVLPYGIDDAQEVLENHRKTTGAENLINLSQSSPLHALPGKEATNITASKARSSDRYSILESKDSNNIRHIVNGLPAHTNGVSQHTSNFPPEHSQLSALSGETSSHTPCGSGADDTSDVYTTRAQPVTSNSNSSTVNGGSGSTAAVAAAARSGLTAGFQHGQQRSNGSKRGDTVWQDILLSLSTEKRSVGVANWLLKGR
ncbi:hypothetical protein RRG08_034156 [Elysia crispata]|nr:hypothetical protein RRG08_034156 [Elysia crispata]